MFSIVSEGSKEQDARLRADATRRIIGEIQSATAAGGISEVFLYERLGALAQLGVLDTQEPLLPLFFRLNNKPYRLDDYQPFGAMFLAQQPPKSIWITGRQVSKSTSIGYRSVVDCFVRPYLRILHVMPQYEQLRRFSNQYVKPAIDNATIRDLLIDEDCERSVLNKSFRNGSRLIFTFALLDAERTRGISADWYKIDEVQNMAKEFVDIIQETVSASDLALATFTGTAKTTDNYIQKLFEDSSQAEWIVPCFACNHYNIPSLDHDVMKMIGPWRRDISEERPGTICARCRRPVNPRYGFWAHRRPSRTPRFQGYHVPQIVMPFHYARQNKWQTLVDKMNSTTAAPHIFINEVLGCSASTGTQLVTVGQLDRASNLPWDNNPGSPAPELMANLDQYDTIVLAADWGGGGDEMISYTKIAVLGYHELGEVHVLWGKQLLTPHEHDTEAKEILYWFQHFGCDALAHDFTGAGTVRETILHQAGVPAEKIFPVALGRSTTEDLMVPRQAGRMGRRPYYMLDKTRSLLLTCQSIKAARVRFFRPDYKDVGNPGLIRDFLALMDEKIETPSGQSVYKIRSSPKTSDDFAQAVNIGAALLWRLNDSWPDFGELLDWDPWGKPVHPAAAAYAGSNWALDDPFAPRAGEDGDDVPPDYDGTR